MDDGSSLDKEKTVKALEAKGLTLALFKKTQTVIPAETYQLNVAGTG